MSTVFVVGSLNIDQRILVPSLPRAGETVSGSEATFSPGGKGGNQAVAAVRAGATVKVVGAVGDDDHAKSVLNFLRECGIAVEHVRSAEAAQTGTAVIAVDEHGENQIIVSPGANALLTNADIESGLETLKEDDVLVLQLEIREELVRFAARLAKSRGAFVVLNAAPSPKCITALFNDIDLLVVNEQEMFDLAQLVELEDRTVELVERLPDVLGAKLLCTAGAKGSFTIVDGEPLHVPAPKVTAVDTTAAGDTFVGYLTANLASGTGMRTAMIRASEASAHTVTRVGAMESIPWAHELSQH